MQYEVRMLIWVGLLLRIGEHGGTLYVYPELFGTCHYGTGKARFELFGTIAEICFGSTHMGGVGHGVLAALGKSEY